MLFFQSQRSIENPRTSLSEWPDDDGMVADSGQRIDRKAALKYSPVWRAVTLLSSTVAKIPCRVMERIDVGKRRATDHPAYSLLRYETGADVSAYNFFQAAMAHCLLEPGNAYAYIDRDRRDGAPVSLTLLPPANVVPVRDGNRLWYTVVLAGGGMAKLDASSVLHFHGPGWDGLCGYSVLEYARNSIAMGATAQKHSNKFFANSAEPRIVLQIPTWVKPEQATQTLEMWSHMHQGSDRAYRTALLQGGMQAKEISLSARDAQLIESLQWSVRDVANWFGVPAHKLGDSSRVAYNSLEQDNQSYLDDTVDPWLVMIEQECRMKLLTEAQKAADSHVIEFDRSALVRVNLTARADYYARGLAGHPWLSVDEVRNAENMNSVGMDEIVAPANNFGAPSVSAPATDDNTDSAGSADDTNDARDAAIAALAEVEQRMRARIQFHVDKMKRRPGVKSTADVVADVVAEHTPVVRSALGPCALTVAALTGDGVDSVVDAAYARVLCGLD